MKLIAPLCSQSAKRPNLIPFPQTEADVDVAMSDSSSDAGLLTPLSIPDYSFHARLPSNASTISSDASSLSNSPTSSRKLPSMSSTGTTSHTDQPITPTLCSTLP